MEIQNIQWERERVREREREREKKKTVEQKTHKIQTRLWSDLSKTVFLSKMLSLALFHEYCTFTVDVPYILAYKSRNFRQKMEPFLCIRLIREPPKLV